MSVVAIHRHAWRSKRRALAGEHSSHLSIRCITQRTLLLGRHRHVLIFVHHGPKIKKKKREKKRPTRLSRLNKSSFFFFLPLLDSLRFTHRVISAGRNVCYVTSNSSIFTTTLQPLLYVRNNRKAPDGLRPSTTAHTQLSFIPPKSFSPTLTGWTRWMVICLSLSFNFVSLFLLGIFLRRRRKRKMKEGKRVPCWHGNCLSLFALESVGWCRRRRCCRSAEYWARPHGSIILQFVASSYLSWATYSPSDPRLDPIAMTRKAP